MEVNNIRKVFNICVIILLMYVIPSFASSNIIFPDTSHKYHGNVAQSNLKEQLNNLNDANTIYFGSYEQDGDKSNGNEAIEWIVLENNCVTHQAILLSKYIIECMRFNGFSEPVTWENSSLRKYLNEEMINDLFDTDEKKCILETQNSNTINIYNNAYSGVDTIDKIYIPSIYDMYKYFTDGSLSEAERYQELLKPNNLRAALVTPHAMNNGVRVMGIGKKYPINGNYFLRTKSPNNKRIWYKDVYESNYVTFVSELGEVKPDGTGISSTDDGIRIMVKIQY